MISSLARGEMNTVILPVQVVALCCALMAFLGGIPLIASAVTMRDSRDRDTQRYASVTFVLGMAMLIGPLIMVIATMFVYQSQGGFQ